MPTENKVKMGVISGASLALKMKQKNPSMPDSAILQKIAEEMPEILDKIDGSI
jgi:hypothetical protein